MLFDGVWRGGGQVDIGGTLSFIREQFTSHPEATEIDWGVAAAAVRVLLLVSPPNSVCFLSLSRQSNDVYNYISQIGDISTN